MKKTLIGKIVNTHGIRGELRIMSSTDFPEQRFAKDMQITVNNIDYKINSMRPHKNFTLVTLDEFNNINQVLFLKNQLVYQVINKTQINSDELHLLELKDKNVFDTTSQKIIGTISDILKNPGNDVLVIKNEANEILIPITKNFIGEFDKQEDYLLVTTIEGMINED
jgi:16S rRNA processing protein RimM